MRGVLFILSVLSAGWHAGVMADQSQKPERRVSLLDYAGPPATFEMFVTQTPAIVVGEITAREQAAFGDGTFAAVVHTVQLRQVLKGQDMKAGQWIEVAQPGGVVRKDGVEYAIDDRSFPVFKVGDRYVLFLTRDKFYGGRWCVGPADAFLLTEDSSRVLIPGGARSIAELATEPSMPSVTFVELIRKSHR